MQLKLNEVIENSFKQSQGICRDKFVFEEDYEPEIIFYRDKEINEITNFFKNVVGGIKDNLDITGPTGTGKTLLVKKISDGFQQRCKSIKTIYLNCDVLNTKSKVLRHISHKLTGQSVGRGTDDFLNKIEEKLVEYEGVIIILDEIDKLLNNSDDRILYTLSNSNKISIINVSNEFNWRSKIEDFRVISRMPANPLNFFTYSEFELFDILMYRINKGLNEGTYTPEVIRDIARYVSNDSGSVRDALKILRKSIDYSDVTGEGKLTLSSINFAKERVEINTIVEHIKHLPPQKQLILMVIFDFWVNQRVYPNAPEIMNKFNLLVKNSKVFSELKLSSVQRYLTELTTYNLIAQLGGKGRGRGLGKDLFTYELIFDNNLFEKEIYNKFMRK